MSHVVGGRGSWRARQEMCQRRVCWVGEGVCKGLRDCGGEGNRISCG